MAAPPRLTTSNKVTVATRVIKSRQPIALAPEGQNPDGTRKLARGLTALPRPAQPASLGPSPIPQDAEKAGEQDVRSITRAISRGRSGVKEIQGLLARQPSLHPPVRGPTPSGNWSEPQDPMTATNSPFATVGGTLGSLLSTGLSRASQADALPALTSGAGFTRSLSIAAPVAKAADPITDLQPAPARPLERHLPGIAPAQMQSSPFRNISRSSGSASSIDGVGSMHRQTEPRVSLDLDPGTADMTIKMGLADGSSVIAKSQAQVGPATGAASGSRDPGFAPKLQLDLTREAQSSLPIISEAASAASPLVGGSLSTGSAPARSDAVVSALPVQMPDGLSQDGVWPAMQQSMHSRQSSRSSSRASRTRSVTFAGAEAAAVRDFVASGGSTPSEHAVQRLDDALQASRAQRQMFHPLRSHGHSAESSKMDRQPGSGSGGADKLVRMSSSLTAAVSETMEDRMLAGGMMHKHADNTSADRCLWPRSILKHTGGEQLPSLAPSRTSRIVSAGCDTVQQDGQGRRTMPTQLAKHHSSLTQVSMRPDFAAAMDAVRASWREEQIGRSASGLGNMMQMTEHPPDTIHDKSSLDAIWASISHDE